VFWDKPGPFIETAGGGTVRPLQGLSSHTIQKVAENLLFAPAAKVQQIGSDEKVANASKKISQNETRDRPIEESY
jgi:hypothetical protein